MTAIYKLRNILPESLKRVARRLLNTWLHLGIGSSSGSMLALKHGTNKWGEGFMEYYDPAFKDLRNKNLNLLEIGIGGFGDARSGGESLRLWQDYFPNAMIYGIDIEDKSIHRDKRIETFQGSQADQAFLSEVADQIGNIDIVIDDGSHINEHVVTSFKSLFPRLANNGLYVIEDVQTAYWPQYGGSWKSLKHGTTSINFFKDLVDGLNYQHIPEREVSEYDRSIASICFFPNMVIISKGTNERTLSQHTLNSIAKAKAAVDEKRLSS